MGMAETRQSPENALKAPPPPPRQTGPLRNTVTPAPPQIPPLLRGGESSSSRPSPKQLGGDGWLASEETLEPSGEDQADERLLKEALISAVIDHPTQQAQIIIWIIPGMFVVPESKARDHHLFMC